MEKLAFCNVGGDVACVFHHRSDICYGYQLLDLTIEVALLQCLL